MSILDKSQAIQEKIQKSVETDYLDFITFLEKIKNPLITKFLEKYLDWHVNNNVNTYVMFDQVIDQSERYLFPNLISFASNYFLDDSYFSVNWYEHEFSDNGDVVDVPCEKESMFAFPIVTFDLDNGTQDPQVILDAMNQYEKNQQLWKEHFEEMDT